jgi:hypothetical protein
MNRKQINSWEDGMDKDTSKRLYPKNRYFNAKNARVISAQELADGGIQTITGNALKTSLPSGYTDHYIIGQGHVGKWAVLFSTKNTGNPSPYISYSGTVTSKYSGDYVSFTVEFNDTTIIDQVSVGDVLETLGNNGIRYNTKVKELEPSGVGTIEFTFYGLSSPSFLDYFNVGDKTITYVPNQYDDVIWKVDLSQDSPTPEKVYEGALQLTKSYPIYNEVVGYYMNEDIQKVYWTDNYNYLRSINIAGDDLDQLTPSKLDIVPDADLINPEFINMSGGNLPVGMVQYAYQLYRDDGSITTFSPTSSLIHLSESSQKEDDDRNYDGSDALDKDGNVNYSGKSVTIKIDNIDLTYSNIRVVNIIYTKIDEEPTINIVSDKVISSTSVEITDNGDNNQGTISLNLFRSLGGTLFKAKTIANKDNILFAANIDEEYFDIDEEGYWDARAYRFNPNGVCKLYKNPNTTDYTSWDLEFDSSTTGSTGAFFDMIDQKSDCANIMNCPSRNIDELIDNWFYTGDNPFGTSNTGSIYLYQSDAETVGGEGPNISYEFVRNIELTTKFRENPPKYFSEQKVYSDYSSYESYSSNSNPLVSGKLRGYKSDEIYPFAIQFFNAKKQQSFVKWIGDIRFPRRNEEPMTEVFDDGSQKYAKTKLYPLGIKFSVDTSDLPSDVTHFRIVRAKKTGNDRTVLAQGLAYFPMICSDDKLRPHFYPTSRVDDNWVTSDQIQYGLNQKALIFQPPDYYYGTTINDADWMVKTGRLSGTVIQEYSHTGNNWYSYYPYSENPGASPLSSLKYNAIRYSTVTDLPDDQGTQAKPVSITQQNKVNSSTDFRNGDEVNIGLSKNFINHYVQNSDIDLSYLERIEGPNAPVLVLTLDTEQPKIKGIDLNNWLIDVKKERIPYNGYSYYNRLQREYIPCSDIKQVTGGTVNVTSYEGDTFLDFTEIMKDIYYGDLSIHMRIIYPVETYINPKLTDRRYSVNNFKENHISLHMYPGYWDYDNDNITELNQLYSFYRYNTVYSKQNEAEIGVPKPDKTLYTKSNTLVKASNPKSRYTVTDEWTNFSSGNELLLESAYGEINKIITSSDFMLFFQDNGFGTLSINETALQKSLSGVQIELGSSGVLSKYRYISRNIGLVHKAGIAVTDMGIYWYDQSNKKFWKYADSLVDLGKQAGMQSYFKSLSTLNDNVFTDTGMVIGHNPFYKELWITTNDGSCETLILNYSINKFVSFFDNSPELYIFDKNGFFDIKGENIYKNDADGYTIYGNSFTPEVTFIVSPNEFPSSMYNVITWLSEKYSGGSQVNELTIDSIRFENDHQDSGLITIQPHNNDNTSYNTRRFNRVWKFDTIRDSNDEHMTDFYLKVTMKWNNQEFVLHTIETYYKKA